jgi:integrase/recombinase XerD
MTETGARAGEILALSIADVDLAAGTAVIVRGKGGKARRVPFGPRAGAAIDRYLRARRRHRLAAGPVLWLGQGGKEFGYHALRDTLRYRAEKAGIDGLHPHLLRHTAAHRWLAAGGSEGGLMPSPGSYLPASDGKYYRWAPGPAAETPDGRALAEQADLIALLAEVREQLDYRRSQMVVTLRPLIT